MKKLLIRLVALFAVFILAGSCISCGKGDENDTGAPIKIAMLFPLSGSAASVGEDARMGFKLAMDYINDNGGIKSLGGRKIEVIFADTQSNEEAAAAEAERLITNEGVVAIAGCYQSAVTASVQVVCERYQTPLMITCSTGDMLTEGSHPFSYRIHEQNASTGITQMAVIKSLMDEYGDIKTAALLYQNDDWGQALHAQWVEGLAELGIEVVVEDVFAEDATDMTGTVSKVMAADPDIILNACYFEPMVQLTNIMAGKNYAAKLNFCSSSGETNTDFIPAVGNNADGFFTASGWGFDVIEAKDQWWINDLCKEAFGEDLNAETAAGWISAFVIVEGLEVGASVDPIELNAAIKSLHISADAAWNMYPHDIEFDQTTGQNIHAMCVVGQFQDTQIKMVYPEIVRLPGVEPVYPASDLAPWNQ